MTGTSAVRRTAPLFGRVQRFSQTQATSVKQKFPPTFQHVKNRQVGILAWVLFIFYSQNNSRSDWADDEEFDEPSTLPAPTITTNKDGTKTSITYSFNDAGKKVKTTRRIRTTVIRETVNPRVAERRAWAKFGLEKGHPAGPSFDTTSVGENIIFRPSVTWKKDDKEAKPDKDSVKAQLKDKKVKCRICDGEHFTARCPFKDTMAPMGEDGVGAAAAPGAADGDEDEAKAGGLGSGGGGYVPPHLRKGAAASGERMGGKYERDDLATLRVTNVSRLKSLKLLWKSAKVGRTRFPSSQRRTTSEISSHALGTSLEFSLPKTGRQIEPRDLRSSATQIEPTLPRLVRSWTAVGLLLFPRSSV